MLIYIICPFVFRMDPFSATVMCFSRLPARGVNSVCRWHVVFQPFACQECGKAYKSKTALRWHVRSHKTGNLFKCDKLVDWSLSLCLSLSAYLSVLQLARPLAQDWKPLQV